MIYCIFSNCLSCYVQPIRGISLLVRAISKIQLAPSQLTSIHADLCKVTWSYVSLRRHHHRGSCQLISDMLSSYFIILHVDVTWNFLRIFFWKFEFEWIVLYVCQQCFLVGCQEEHPACKNWMIGCRCGYLSGTRCRLFAYGLADATVIPKPHSLLPLLNPHLPRLSWTGGR